MRWGLAPAIAVHNFEEWLTVRAYGGMSAELSRKLGVAPTPVDWATTQAALLLVTVVPITIIIICSTGVRSLAKDFAVCWLAGLFCANVFLPHIPAAIAAGGYAPGVLSALLVNLPLALILFRAALVEGRLTRVQLGVAAAAGAMTLPIAIALAYTLVERVS